LALFYTGNSTNRKTGSLARYTCSDIFPAPGICDLVSLARVTGLKIIRLASSKLAFYGKADELGPVVMTSIAACLHQVINGVHGFGFH